ncbi:MAG: class I SAM-dependent methyltransferase [Clostridiales bacterium]|nr:class I SAM-dependent methyltransferase [Clostridiales bacterium]
MGRLGEYLGKQCGNPTGIVGKIMTWGMNRVNKFMYKGIIDEIKPNKQMVMLDIGFGNGFLEKLIYKRVHCNIYGIDISEDMLNIALHKNCVGVKNGDIELSIGDCCDLVFENDTFDVVTTMNTIYFWNDTLKGLQEIHRTLKDGGTFCNAVLSKEYLKKVFYTKNVFKFFDKEDYISLGKQAGFKNITIKELKKSCYLVIYSK